MKAQIVIIIASVVWCVLVGLRPLRAAKMSPDIERALTDNALQLNPITVNWKQYFESSHTQEEVIADLMLNPRLVLTMFTGQMRQFIWQDGRFYSHTTQLQTDPPQSLLNIRDIELAFDGRFLYSRSVPLEAQRGQINQKINLMKTSIEKELQANGAANILDRAYFDEMGVVPPACAVDLQAKIAKSTILALVEQGASIVSVDPVTIDNQDLIRIRIVGDNEERRRALKVDLVQVERDMKQDTQPQQYKDALLKAIKQRRQLPEHLIYTFDLDPALHYAMRSSAIGYDDGRLISSTECSEFHALAGREIQLPYKYIKSFYTYDTNPGQFYDKPIMRCVYNVTNVGTERVDENKFVLEAKSPGASIYDKTQPLGMQQYQVPATIAQLDSAIIQSNHIMHAPESVGEMSGITDNRFEFTEINDAALMRPWTKVIAANLAGGTITSMLYLVATHRRRRMLSSPWF